MSSSMMKDARVKGVGWRDLVALRWWEKLWELVLSWPWLGASLWCYQAGWWGVGAVGSFFFFLTGLRQSHNAQHYCLGIGRRAQDWLMFGLSAAMLSSMHGVQVTHMHHHRHCLDEQDIEAGHANRAWWWVLLMGPLIMLRLHRGAWRLGRPKQRRWMVWEWLAVVGLAVVVWGVVDVRCLRWHFAAMAVGEWLSGFFAVWTVHHGCDAQERLARTQRGWLKNVVSYSMFYHLEHHLFPAVPTCHLPKLSMRLDEAAPELKEMEVL